MAEKIYIQVNGERVEATGAVRDQILADRAEAEALEAERVAEEQAQAEMKASAVSKLEALGLTVDEVRVAFGLEVE